MGFTKNVPYVMKQEGGEEDIIYLTVVMLR